ncbi:MAG: hypothetical protein IIB57_16110 [Planctomycetes bacterium]|nr:hypothetical protein [Planctomycetota bacterium]
MTSARRFVAGNRNEGCDQPCGVKRLSGDLDERKQRVGEQQRTKCGIPENVLVDRASDAGIKVRLTVVFSEAVVVKN